MGLSAIDEYDVRCSFDVQDEDKVNKITVEDFHTLYLGLGFKPIDLTLDELKKLVEHEYYKLGRQEDKHLVSLQIVLEVLSRFSRNRESEMEKCFNILDNENKGYISAQDIKRLAMDVGQTISSEVANVLVSKDKFSKRDLANLLNPPSP